MIKAVHSVDGMVTTNGLLIMRIMVKNLEILLQILEAKDYTLQMP